MDNAPYDFVFTTKNTTLKIQRVRSHVHLTAQTFPALFPL
jgi:hypothetical protein